MYTQFNVLGDHPLIPEEAFLFVPQRSNDPKILRDDFKIGEGKGIRRLLFEGWAEQTYTPYELQKLKEFDQYVQHKHIELDPRWKDKSWRLRWLLSTGCDIKKTVEDMHKYILYQNSVQNLSFTSNVAKFLNKGIYYMVGRDCHYRPIFVFDVEKILSLEMSEDQVLETQTYFFQYVLRNLLIPGQVQNWVVILDAAHTGLFSLVGSMKKSFSFLSDTYRSRMFVCYVVRIPASISFLWGIVKRFLEEETVRKINFFDQSIVEPLFEYCNPSQVEAKFGGTLPNLQQGQFWPPREVSSDYHCQKDPIKMLTREQYTSYYNNKTFYNTKFHEQNIIKPKTKDDLRQNKNAHTIRKIQRQFKHLLQTAEEDPPLIKFKLPPHKRITYQDFIKMSQQKTEQQEEAVKSKNIKA